MTFLHELKKNKSSFKMLLAGVFLIGFVTFLFGQEMDDLDKKSVVKIHRTKGRSSLVVPKSFAGRTGTENFEGTSLELLNRIEFTRTESKTRLAGTVTKFDFDATTNALRGLAWESRKIFPRSHACMDCHDSGVPKARTQLWFGDETKVLTPKRVYRGSASILFPDADVLKSYVEVRHWVTPHQVVQMGASRGKLRSYVTTQRAHSEWLGWSWHDRKFFHVSSELKMSKAELYPVKREFIGRVGLKGKKGFSLDLQGGILLDGFAQYDLGFSDVGAVVVSTERAMPEDLPSLYTRMKSDRFGYYTIQARYEYAF